MKKLKPQMSSSHKESGTDSESFLMSLTFKFGCKLEILGILKESLILKMLMSKEELLP